MYKYLLLIIVLLVTSCATKRKTKEVEKSEIKTENTIKNDSSVNLQLQKSTYDYLQNYSKTESLMQKLGLIYSGKSNEDKAKVSLKQTKDGLDIDIQGAIAMALEKEQTKSENITVQKVISLVDSVYNVRLQQDLKQREQRLLDSFKSDTEKSKIDFSFWIYVLIGGIVCFVIFLVFITIQINHLKKTQAIIGGK
ncbi:hypothetical protein ACTS95_08240 [Empedobacter brevis]